SLIRPKTRSGWHQHFQNLIASASLSKQPLCELQYSRQSFARDRVDLLTHSCLFIGKFESLRFSATTSRPLNQGLRYATQAKVAFDRFLLAHLSRFKPGDLLAELVKDLGRPAKIPRLNHSHALPMRRIGQQKARRVV